MIKEVKNNLEQNGTSDVCQRVVAEFAGLGRIQTPVSSVVVPVETKWLSSKSHSDDSLAKRSNTRAHF